MFDFDTMSDDPLLPAGPPPAGTPVAPGAAPAGQVWEVVGGKDKGGILVRSGRETTSPQEPARLSCGARVTELELVGERLRYELLTGTGPAKGWVSVRFNGTDLAVRVGASLVDAGGGSAAGAGGGSPSSTLSPKASAAVLEEKARLRQEAEELKKQIEQLQAVRNRIGTGGVEYPQGLMPWSRHRNGPTVSVFRAYAAEDSNYKGFRTGTAIKFCERNRNESFGVYKLLDPPEDNTWLTVMIEICLETFPDFDRVCRKRHNGDVEGDYVRVESRAEYGHYPFRMEQEDIFHCPGKGFSREGGTQIARFRAMGSKVTDEGGMGVKYELLADGEKPKFDACVGNTVKYHGSTELREKVTPGGGIPALFPKRGKPFRPTRSWTGIFKVDWSTADIYNTLYHPSIGDVLARAHHQCGWKFVAGKDIVSIYLKMFTRVEPGADMQVFIYMEEETMTEIFIFQNFQESTQAWGGVAMFDPDHYELTFEAGMAVKRACPALMGFSKAGPTAKPSTAMPSLIDLSVCKQ